MKSKIIKCVFFGVSSPKHTDTSVFIATDMFLQEPRRVKPRRVKPNTEQEKLILHVIYNYYYTSSPVLVKWPIKYII